MIGRPAMVFRSARDSPSINSARQEGTSWNSGKWVSLSTAPVYLARFPFTRANVHVCVDSLQSHQLDAQRQTPALLVTVQGRNGRMERGKHAGGFLQQPLQRLGRCCVFLCDSILQQNLGCSHTVLFLTGQGLHVKQQF